MKQLYMSTPKPTIANFEHHWYVSTCAKNGFDIKNPETINLMLAHVETLEQLNFLQFQGANVVSSGGANLLRQVTSSTLESDVHVSILKELLSKGGSHLIDQYMLLFNHLPLENCSYLPKFLTVFFKSGIDWSVFEVAKPHKPAERAIHSAFLQYEYRWGALEKMLSYPKAYQKNKNDLLEDIATHVSGVLSKIRFNRSNLNHVKRGVKLLNKVILVSNPDQLPTLTPIISNSLQYSSLVGLENASGVLQVVLASVWDKTPSSPKSISLEKLINKRNKTLNDVAVLLAKNINMNMRTSRHQTFLEEAVRTGNVSVTQKIIENGADPNTICFGLNKISILQMACLRDMPVVVKLLLDRGADPSYCAGDNSTALINAVQSGSLKSIDLLHAKGVDLNAVDASGRHCLFFLEDAETVNLIPLLHHLIQLGASPFVRDNKGHDFVGYFEEKWPNKIWKRDAPALLVALKEYVSALSSHEIMSSISDPSHSSLASKRKRM